VAVKGQMRDEGKSKSYHIKAASITDCPWREVIYLVSLGEVRKKSCTELQDSDSIPLADPDALFSAPSYQRLGIWATPDYWKTPSNNPMWAIMGVKCRNEWEMESGQMVIDKKRHLDVMLLVRYMMEHHDFVSLPLCVYLIIVVQFLRWR
jgi:alpha 1,2-mannosyltransferase